MSTYITTGFVLNSKAWREGDRLYTIFTEREGKIELIAAGARKAVSKLSSHLQPFAEVELMVARGKQLDRLASANLKELYLRPPYGLNTAVLGTALLEVVDVLTRAGEPEPKLHQLLRHYLSELINLPANEEDWRLKARWLLARYLIEVLKLVGLAVSLTRCEHCRGELVDPVDFSWVNHSFAHHSCIFLGDKRVAIPSSALTWLQQAAGLGIAQTDAPPPTVLAFLTDYVVGQAGRELYTLKVLRSIL
jgi:DNA repair protein RecO